MNFLDSLINIATQHIQPDKHKPESYPYTQIEITCIDISIPACCGEMQQNTCFNLS